MLQAAELLPTARKADARTQIVAGFHKHREEDRAEVVTELLSDAKKRLEFMYSLIPRHKRPDFRKTAQTASATFVVKDGVVVDGRAVAKEKARYSNWGMGNLDPDDVARHDHQMRRFQFLDRPGGPPAGPVWD